MSSLLRVTFVAAVNSQEILQDNLLASPGLQGQHGHEILLQEGFGSAAKAYNDALRRATNELVVFVHQDIFLPEDWLSQLENALNVLANSDPNWGVLGCWGMTRTGEGFGYAYSPGEGVIGKPLDHPMAVQTLDEIVLVLRKSSGLGFDEGLPHFHFYGTDICMAAAKKGMKCYAISAFCVHNAKQYFSYPEDFYGGYRYIKRIYKEHLPIQTSCIRITRFDSDLYLRQLRRAYSRIVKQAEPRGSRVEDPQTILRELRESHQI